MLRVHTADGRTATVDLSDERQAADWVRRLARADVARSVTGLTLVETHATSGRCPACGVRCQQPLGLQFSIARPEDFRAVSFDAEHVEAAGRVRGGDRLLIYADDIRLSVMAHAETPAVRVVVSKVGKRRFNPNQRLIDGNGERE
jgi:hypothetical protein